MKDNDPILNITGKLTEPMLGYTLLLSDWSVSVRGMLQDIHEILSLVYTATISSSSALSREIGVALSFAFPRGTSTRQTFSCCFSIDGSAASNSGLRDTQ